MSQPANPVDTNRRAVDPPEPTHSIRQAPQPEGVRSF